MLDTFTLYKFTNNCKYLPRWKYNKLIYNLKTTIQNHLAMKMTSETPNQSSGLQLDRIDPQLGKGLVFTSALSIMMDEFT